MDTANILDIKEKFWHGSFLDINEYSLVFSFHKKIFDFYLEACHLTFFFPDNGI